MACLPGSLAAVVLSATVELSTWATEVPKPSAQEAARERRARDLHAVMAAAAEAYHRRLFLPHDCIE